MIFYRYDYDMWLREGATNILVLTETLLTPLNSQRYSLSYTEIMNCREQKELDPPRFSECKISSNWFCNKLQQITLKSTRKTVEKFQLLNSIMYLNSQIPRFLHINVKGECVLCLWIAGSWTTCPVTPSTSGNFMPLWLIIYC